MHGEIERSMPHLKSRGHLTGSPTGCTEERSGRKGGEEMEGGGEGTVDGQPQGTKLGQEWQRSLSLLKPNLRLSFEALGWLPKPKPKPKPKKKLA